ncbi:DinB family protein [Blastococcus sp. VKM Ac-2987]|uniref:DinB family protein n=1 Tax=Blastococcus sp. VKM Ac-2987 TaxID=3004141 RepID=UPI0022AB8A31|nr:DinB family protein [Blastococcus sp. VKM Ac-2987]MCZ2860969.1 DinB family protein [Blastococcus sp. VKM Ac-2987]
MTDAAGCRADLAQYLQEARDVVLLKTEGLSEYDVRRPLTPTGTNLLGLVKHLALVEVGYFSVPFGRPVGLDHPWFADDAEDNADMWATAREPRDDVVAGYRRAWAQTDAAVAELPLDTVGRVPWWGQGGEEVTLHRVLVHVIGETHRHAGHADIVRELVDGSVGNQWVGDNLPERDDRWWRAYRDRLEQTARAAAGE